jgi:excisionase family DNA binding protein
MTQQAEETYTIAEAAALTGLHRNTIRMRVKLGQLLAARAVGKFGEEYRISRQALVDAGLLAPPEPAPSPEAPTAPIGDATLHSPHSGLPPSGLPSQELLSDLLQRHEQAMFRLGFLESELGRQKSLAENAESLQAVARERELEVRDLRRELERAQEREREIDELRGLLREMERTTQQMRDEVERHRAAAARRWWHFFGPREPADRR